MRSPLCERCGKPTPGGRVNFTEGRNYYWCCLCYYHVYVRKTHDPLAAALEELEIAP